MSFRPANKSSENTDSNQYQDLPLRALAIGILPADLSAQPRLNCGVNAAGGSGEGEDIGCGPGRALAIGPSGPAIRSLSEAEFAAQASAVNFNPYHDARGRFTTGDGVGGGKNDDLDGQGGGETKPESIARYPYPREGKQNYARCVLYSLQTIIAAKTGKEAPSEAEVQARFEAEVTKLGLRTIIWGSGTYLRSSQYATIVQNVLKSYGIDSSSKIEYNSMQDLANAIIAAHGEPAMLNVALAGHEGVEEHSVTVQWEPSDTDKSKGMFRLNNIAAEGGSKVFSQKDFTSGKIFSDINPTGSARSARTKVFSIDTKYAVVIAKPR